jgi:hypothetical protein
MEKFLQTALLLLGILTCTMIAQSPGDLLITEFMADPAAVFDANGEYMELYNMTNSPIDINGFVLRDDDFDSHTIDNGGSLIVSAMSFVVLARNGDSNQNGGFNANYVYTGFALANSGDEIVLEIQSPADTVEICRLNYTANPFGPGVSAELNNVVNHVNGVTLEIDYVAATAPYGLGDLGSPGSAGNTQGTAGDDPPVIINLYRTPRIPAENENTTVSADVIDNSVVTLVELRYKINNGTTQSVGMINTGGDTYSADIPEPAYNTADRVEYWIYAEDDIMQSTETARLKFFTGSTPINFLRPVDTNGVLLYDGYDVRVEGVCTAESGIFSASRLDVYIQDAGGGINIFQLGLTGGFTITRGNDYTVVGTVGQLNGKAEVVTSDYNTDIVDNGPGNLPSPVVMTIAQFLADPETCEGMLIAIANVSKTGNGDPWPTEGSDANVEITDDGGTSLLTLRINPDTNIDGSPEPTWPVNVEGIFNQHDFSLPYDSFYQIMPRDLDDIGVTVGIEPLSGDEVVRSFKLHGNYPNPFNPVTALRFDIPVATGKLADIQLTVYNSLGQKVKTLVNDQLPAGAYEVQWNGLNANGAITPSGVYFAELTMNSLQRQVIKMVMMK